MLRLGSFIALLLIFGTAAGNTPTTAPGVVVTGTIDSKPFTCRAVAQTTFQYITGQGHATTTFDCGTPTPVACEVQSWSYNNGFLTVACQSQVPTSAFAVVHLPQITTIAAGASAQLLVQAYNNTGANFSAVTISASGAPACSKPAQPLGSGGVISYVCQSPALTDSLADSITVTAVTSQGAQYAATATANIVVDSPRLTLDVTPPSQNVVFGNNATWGVRVSNPGPTALTAAIIVDQHTESTCGATVASIASNAVVTYNCSISGITTSFPDVFAASALNGATPLEADRTVQVNAVPDLIFAYGFEHQ